MATWAWLTVGALWCTGAGLAIPLFLVDAFLQFYQEDTASELYSLSIFGTRTPLIQVLALASVMTLATGFGEEILFRGLVQQVGHTQRPLTPSPVDHTT